MLSYLLSDAGVTVSLATNAALYRNVAKLQTSWGWPVEYAAGWETRTNGSAIRTPSAVTVHHTGGKATATSYLLNPRDRPQLKVLANMHITHDHRIKILAAGSIAAKNGGVASGPAYVASKAAVHGMIRWMAKAGAPHGVYANTLAPGPVETAMWARVTGQAAPAANATVPLGRYGNAEDIAQAALFLCSPAAAYVTGVLLPVDGGMVAA